MGKELSLAREEEERQPVLLASPSTRELITTSSSGDKRTQESSPSKSSKGGKVKDTKAKSKGSGKAKGTYARYSESARRRRDNKDRKSDRGDEREDSRPRRNAQELGIIYPDSYCDDAKLVPHYWIENGKVDRGSLFQCRICRRYLWLPTFHIDADKLGKLMKKHGYTEGYCQYLNRHRPAKLLMAKLQDLRRLEIEITDKMEFARLTDKILSDKEYDRKEVSDGGL